MLNLLCPFLCLHVAADSVAHPLSASTEAASTSPRGQRADPLKTQTEQRSDGDSLNEQPRLAHKHSSIMSIMAAPHASPMHIRSVHGSLAWRGDQRARHQQTLTDCARSLAVAALKRLYPEVVHGRWRARPPVCVPTMRYCTRKHQSAISTSRSAAAASERRGGTTADRHPSCVLCVLLGAVPRSRARVGVSEFSCVSFAAAQQGDAGCFAS